MNKFDEAYKYGMKLQIPDNIDKEVVEEWTEDQKVIFQKANEGNYLVACIDDSSGTEDLIYSFMRFFSLGDNTQCSVDFQASSQKQMIELITHLLAKKYTF